MRLSLAPNGCGQSTEQWRIGKPNSPKNFFPRLDAIIVYALTVERMTGKERILPELSEQWPAKDQTMTPNARP
jgi:uncharacterized protein